jgi:ribosomal protein L3
MRIDVENNLLLVKGAVPGYKNSYVIIKKALKTTARAASAAKSAAVKEKKK